MPEITPRHARSDAQTRTPAASPRSSNSSGYFLALGMTETSPSARQTLASKSPSNPGWLTAYRKAALGPSANLRGWRWPGRLWTVRDRPGGWLPAIVSPRSGSCRPCAPSCTHSQRKAAQSLRLTDLCRDPCDGPDLRYVCRSEAGVSLGRVLGWLSDCDDECVRPVRGGIRSCATPCGARRCLSAYLGHGRVRMAECAVTSHTEGLASHFGNTALDR